MSVAGAILQGQLTTPQGGIMPKPVTFAAASTIAPTTLVSFVAGTTAVATVTPPVEGQHILCIIPTSTNWAGMVTTGNVIVASVTNGTNWQNRVVVLVYNPINQKYYPNYPVLT